MASCRDGDGACTCRCGKKVRKADKFLSPQHTSFDLSAKIRKVVILLSQNDTWYYDGEFTATFGKLFPMYIR